MTHLQIEHTMKGSTSPSKRQYHSSTEASTAWEGMCDSLMGGDHARLIDLETGRVMSEYHPVDHVRADDNGSW
jgi:hypothetical protein